MLAALPLALLADPLIAHQCMTVSLLVTLSRLELYEVMGHGVRPKRLWEPVAELVVISGYCAVEANCQQKKFETT